MELDNQLVRQDIVTYSAYYADHADLRHTMPVLIKQIEKRQEGIDVNNDTSKQDAFVDSIEKLYTQMHKIVLDRKRQQPNIRVFLGFA